MCEDRAGPGSMGRRRKRRWSERGRRLQREEALAWALSPRLMCDRAH